MKKHHRIHLIFPRHLGLLHYLSRQLIALVIIIAGLLISIPGIPGPGFLLVISGVLLLSFPGKRALLHSLSGQKYFRYVRVCLRKRFNITLVMPEPRRLVGHGH